MVNQASYLLLLFSHPYLLVYFQKNGNSPLTRPACKAQERGCRGAAGGHLIIFVMTEKEQMGSGSNWNKTGEGGDEGCRSQNFAGAVLGQ